MPGRLNVHGDPFGMETRRHRSGGPHQTGSPGLHVHADHDRFGGRPRSDHGMVAAIHLHLLVDPLGGSPESHFAQCDQIPLAEEILERLLRLLRHVDFAVFQTLQQVIGGEIDQLDIIGLFKHRVRHRFTHPHSSDLSHHIVQTFQMLHIDGRIDVDARLQQFLHVLPSFRMPGTRGIRVGQFVHENELRTTGERGIEIEFPQGRSTMLDQHVAAESSALPAGLPFPHDHAFRPTRSTTSTPSRRCSCAACSIAYVFPTPAVAPKKTLSLPRVCSASSACTRLSKSSGSGLRSSIRCVRSVTES